MFITATKALTNRQTGRQTDRGFQRLIRLQFLCLTGLLFLIFNPKDSKHRHSKGDCLTPNQFLSCAHSTTTQVTLQGYPGSRTSKEGGRPPAQRNTQPVRSWENRDVALLWSSTFGIYSWNSTELGVVKSKKRWINPSWKQSILPKQKNKNILNVKRSIAQLAVETFKSSILQKKWKLNMR